MRSVTQDSPVQFSTALVLPTLNAECYLPRLVPALKALSPAPDEILIIDSSSDDDTARALSVAGFHVHVIPRESFGHGRTRNLAVSMVRAQVVMFMTQDVMPHDPGLVEAVIRAFASDQHTAHVFVRQIPHDDATPTAQFSRHFNYPSSAFKRSLDDVQRVGVRAFFTSNACAAYRRDVFNAVGGFDEHVPVSEDTLLAARILQAGYNLQYVSDASVKHSHNYTMTQEFKRYFDIGAAHVAAPWYDAMASNVSNEGQRYVALELRYLLSKRVPHLIPVAFMRNCLRWLGYNAGRMNKRIPMTWRRMMAMSPHHWSPDRGEGI
jgi:rhamnosyltransferase